MRSWPRCCGCRPGVRPAVSDRFSKVASPLPSPPPEGEGAQIREGPQSARVPQRGGGGCSVRFSVGWRADDAVRYNDGAAIFAE